MLDGRGLLGGTSRGLIRTLRFARICVLRNRTGQHFSLVRGPPFPSRPNRFKPYSPRIAPRFGRRRSKGIVVPIKTISRPGGANRMGVAWLLMLRAAAELSRTHLPEYCRRCSEQHRSEKDPLPPTLHSLWCQESMGLPTPKQEARVVTVFVHRLSVSTIARRYSRPNAVPRPRPAPRRPEAPAVASATSRADRPGFCFEELTTKRLQLLREAVPLASRNLEDLTAATGLLTRSRRGAKRISPDGPRRAEAPTTPVWE